MRLLFFTSVGLGEIYPLVPVLEELRRRGHEVLVRTTAEGVDVLDPLGFSAEGFDPAIEAIVRDDWRYRTSAGGMQRTLQVYMERGPYELADLRQAIGAYEPDLIALDASCAGAAAAAEEWGGPWAQFAAYPLPIPSRGVPPYSLGLRPSEGRVAAIRDKLLERVMVESYNRKHLPTVNRMRIGAGLEPLRHGLDIWSRAQLILSFTAQPLEYERSDWPASVTLVGPSSWDPPSERPAWLAEIDAPIVLVTLSSDFQDDGKLASAALAGLANENVFVVVTTAAVDPSSLDVPANARVERFVPHRHLVDRASVVVCHSMGITQKALAAGVPVVAVPFGRDQLELARRVEVADAGVRLPAWRLNARTLRKAVAQAASKRQGAERVGRAFREIDSGSIAADALEGLYAGHQRSRVAAEAPRATV